MLLSTGSVQADNKSDFLLFPTALVPADRYYTMKSEILESVGLNPKELFPVYADRFPNQMLSYLRLARVQDPALFAKVGGPLRMTCCVHIRCTWCLSEVTEHPHLTWFGTVRGRRQAVHQAQWKRAWLPSLCLTSS